MQRNRKGGGGGQREGVRAQWEVCSPGPRTFCRADRTWRASLTFAQMEASWQGPGVRSLRLSVVEKAPGRSDVGVHCPMTRGPIPHLHLGALGPGTAGRGDRKGQAGRGARRGAAGTNRKEMEQGKACKQLQQLLPLSPFPMTVPSWVYPRGRSKENSPRTESNSQNLARVCTSGHNHAAFIKPGRLT